MSTGERVALAVVALVLAAALALPAVLMKRQDNIMANQDVVEVVDNDSGADQYNGSDLDQTNGPDVVELPDGEEE